ncbi:hypothetical protein PROPEN_02977 [Proteus penneri ATCC 35198]|nr:hypothetical protein PROPEN_02977 [Proteus penneri ATCC 35198]
MLTTLFFICSLILVVTNSLPTLEIFQSVDFIQKIDTDRLSSWASTLFLYGVIIGAISLIFGTILDYLALKKTTH